MTYFIKQTFRKSGPWEKADCEPFIKADPMTKFTVFVKTTLGQIRDCWFTTKSGKSGIFGPKVKDF